MKKLLLGILVLMSLSTFAEVTKLESFVLGELYNLQKNENINIKISSLQCVDGTDGTGVCTAQGDFMSPNSSSTFALIVYKPNFEEQHLKISVQVIDGEF